MKIILSLAVVLVGGSLQPAHADDVADFYRGKTVNLTAGFNPGGGADTYARVIGRHLGKHIPGNPTVIVRNMQGAGSVIAANHIYNVR
jgi:tripartite-type tricarboxylate transporter receptor subunit TctC